MNKLNHNISIALLSLTVSMTLLAEGSWARAAGRSTASSNSNGEIAQIFQPPDTQAPKDTSGGASRGSQMFVPPEQLAPRDTSGAASRNGEFEPPVAGVPGRRVGAGTRGDITTLMAIVPASRYGITVAARPTFFVYVPPAAVTSDKQIFLSIQDEHQDLHYQTRIDLPASASGIVTLQLPESAPELEVGKNYKWFFILTEPGQKLRADTNGETGWVQRVALTPEMERQQTSGASLDLALSYGRSGIWYDMVATLAMLKQTQPGNPALHQSWQTLLSEVGMAELAAEAIVPLPFPNSETVSNITE